ncbi:peptidase S10 [Trinickia caryophylli]|uniref:Carboxypeptidase C (Cathepsin A) n=1 Tax=Trinickia caryophylli TaxID=28094 RepID=A0A1X7CV83_TRICW|nr:peptidase S10 [Trinickia caryophylli]PMS13601.1 peptidase S10 [Trinickia caryophylli]TRX13734.1 peptidase S10 [Trinickia caryophylli]WQE15325.1 peptidase S10 [Trinickia caryophylli]SMF03696.1 Carboxypeptidase C (cathepsin A) [Trinickia caryophylli]
MPTRPSLFSSISRPRFACGISSTTSAAVLSTAIALTALTALTAMPTAALAEEETPEHASGVPADDPHASLSAPSSGAAAAQGASASVAVAVPPETSSTTEHAVRVGGRRIAYTATAGTLLLRDGKGKADASVFYVAYTAHANDPSRRPITFLFNGGPGAGSIFLLMGSVGPKRVNTSSPAPTPPAPYALRDNPDSLIDKTDLVFVDAVGTGFSRPLDAAAAKRFYGVDGDLDAFGRFIDRYLTVNQRWNSPKFLFGESYGTTRAAMLAYSLGQRHIAINGVVLLSSVLNANVHAPGYDLMDVRFLPSYAAVAWYHHKIPDVPAGGLPALLDEARAFAAGPYATALAKGDALPDAERDAVAEQLARYTGLGKRFVIEARLRIPPSLFRKELLRGETRSVGRYDGRFEGIEANDAYDSPDYDASEKYVTSAFNAAFHDHLARDLHYTAQSPYRIFNDAVLSAWNWKHHAWWGESLELPYAAGDLAEAIRRNPRLRVFSANGYFDLATPFFSTEYDLAHMGLEPSLRGNLTIAYYSSGHMVYLDNAALHALKADLARFYDAAGASMSE